MVGTSDPKIFGPIAEITNIHLYDGKNKVMAFDGLHRTGDHNGKIDALNSWDINPPIIIYSGLGISVGVSFPDDTPMVSSYKKLRFATVGAEFNIP